jgi:hypothetical protein
MNDEANAQAVPAPEAEKSLDELLGEFNEPQPQPQPQEVQQPNAMDEVVDFVREVKTERLQEKLDTGISGAVETMMKEESLSKLDPDIVEGFLHGRAYKNANFQKAFETREQNPAAWNKAVSDATKELSTKMSKPDEQITSDLAAAKAAVSGVSNTAPEQTSDRKSALELNRMSDAQFNAYKQSLLAR